MAGFELGPTKGASLGVFFFFGGFLPIFFRRASVAAARSSRILARSSGLRFGSIAAGGKSSSIFIEEFVSSLYFASSPVPNR